MLAHLLPENCTIKQPLDHHPGPFQIRESAMNIPVYVCMDHILAPAVAPEL